MKKKLRIGVIGLGVGRRHVECYQSHPQCSVIAVCDYLDEKLAVLEKLYPEIKKTKNAMDILESPDIDVVSIASYDDDHYAQICAAINHDKHVFVEKPLCLYEAQAAAIRDLLKKKPHLKLSSNLVLRRTPRFQLLKKMIAAGDMGELFYVEGDYNYGRLEKITQGWRGDLEFYSVMYGGGVHLIDLLLWLTEDQIEEVSAFGNNISSKNTKYRYNDMIVGVLKFRSGLVGKVAANFGCVFPHFHQLAVYGTKGTFINGLKNGLLYQSRNPQDGPKIIDTAYPGTHKGELILNFIDSILSGAISEVSPDDVFNTMSVCFALEKAMTSKSVIQVQYI